MAWGFTKIRMTPKGKQSCLGKIYFLSLNHILIPNLKQTRKKYMFFSYFFLHFIDIRDQIESWEVPLQETNEVTAEWEEWELLSKMFLTPSQPFKCLLNNILIVHTAWENVILNRCCREGKWCNRCGNATGWALTNSLAAKPVQSQLLLEII